MNHREEAEELLKYVKHASVEMHGKALPPSVAQQFVDQLGLMATRAQAHATLAMSEQAPASRPLVQWKVQPDTVRVYLDGNLIGIVRAHEDRDVQNLIDLVLTLGQALGATVERLAL